ncbi:hypothetical protein HWV62_8178 [Athelia sp. TMB]|nr:hypothetical protein HWV62_8178 [Athelia sp. TMB]
MISPGYVAPFPPLSTQPYPPARVHPRWQELYQLHDKWVMKHWPFPTESKRAKLPAARLAGVVAWAAPFADFDRLVRACRLTGVLILADDLVNTGDQSAQRIAGFKHVAAGNAPLHPTDQAELALHLALDAIKRDCHPRTYAQLTRLIGEWWDVNACQHRPAPYADLDTYLAGRATETGITLTNRGASDAISLAAAIRYAADINLTDAQLAHPRLQHAERLVAEHAVLASDLLAYSADKTPASGDGSIFSVLGTHCQLSYDEARGALENKMRERERAFVGAGVAVYDEAALGADAEVRRWVACLPYGMGGYLAWSQEWNSGHDESVEVNQRALIDKVLARYSGEFTVFRELLQNSDDAQSKAVEIRFETERYTARAGAQAEAGGLKEALPDLKKAPVHRWVFKNNGMLFRDQDWSRLKKIAEGNPDEEKIGAFGVGFYSLFSVTEEPFVTSGGAYSTFNLRAVVDVTQINGWASTGRMARTRWAPSTLMLMGRADSGQLFARRGTLPQAEGAAPDPWTSFQMDLREPGPIPSPFDFTRFVASSITFMAHLAEVSIFFDDRRLARLTKAPGIPRALGIPKNLRRSSAKNLMTATGIKSTSLHIKAEVMRWVYISGTQKPQKPTLAPPKPSGPARGGFLATFSSFFNSGGANTPQRAVTPVPEQPVVEVDPLTVTETQVTLLVYSVDVDVKLPAKLATELHRSTKKNPPSKLKYELIYTAKDEYDASIKEDEQQPFASGSVFQGLRADLDGDRTVAEWNKELLYVGGFLARAAYEIELASIRDLWHGATAHAPPDPELRSWLTGRALHALKFFVFHTSTPSSDVSTLLEAAFFSCSDSRSFPIISTSGVRNTADVRLPDATFSTFIKQLPVLPDEVVTEGKRMVASLQARSMIRDISWTDVLEELRRRPLPETEMIACLKWWIGMCKQGHTTELPRIRTELLNAAVLVTGTPGSSDEGILQLNAVQTFLNTRKMGGLLPTDEGSPLPKHMLPLSVSKHLDPSDLLLSCPWRELTVFDWIQHIISPEVTRSNVQYDITKSAPWAERVFLVLARAWPSLSQTAKQDICASLQSKECVPTTAGMKVATAAYFEHANIFKDLPVVTLPSGTAVKGTIEAVFKTMGVRDHVELQIVFDRMVKTGDWATADLVKYLVSIKDKLSGLELDRLKATSAFRKEGETNSNSSRYKASDLYEPQESLRQLSLPILDWGTNMKWKNGSTEAQFLTSIGLRRFPPLKVIIESCAHQDPTLRHVALKYLLDNYQARYSDYDPAQFPDIAFVPALNQGKPCMSVHKEVFSRPEWASLGYLIAHPSLQADALLKLKIRERPDASTLMNLLEKTPPKDEATARAWFGALSGHISDFNPSQLARLSQMHIVPVKKQSTSGKETQASDLRWLPPSQCYFAGEPRAQFHSKLFAFVDFGVPANTFLSVCGTKNEPSVEEVTRILLDNPHDFYELADGRDNFLIELRNIAVNRRQISSVTLTRMKKSPILLASQRKRRIASSKSKNDPTEDLDEDDWDLVYDLKRADQVVIADDTNGYQLFGDQIFCAPQEDILEAFYLELGSRRLSSLAREDYQTSKEIKPSPLAAHTRSLILERLPLFLHEHTHSRPKVSHSWLADPKNFIVREFGKLTVMKSLSQGNVQVQRSQDASAAARRVGYGPIELWLAGHSQVDMYEVAISLCRLLFDAPKVNDALLFMTILSTDLRSLKRRGYNVDRILKQQKAERKAIDDARAAENNNALLSKPSQLELQRPPAPPAIPADTRPPAPIANLPEQPTSPKFPGSFESQENGQRDSKGAGNLIQNWKRKITGTAETNRPQSGGLLGASQGASNNGASGEPRPRTPTVTPQSNISSNIDMAIKACREEQGHLLRNREHMQTVKESLDEGYCDISGRAGDLDFIGEMGNVKVYVSRDVPEPKSIMYTKRDTLARFIHVIQPLAKVYKLPSTSMHIFYDLGGEMIAFNRNASIFVNLRYFEAWHDKDVQNGNLSPAYISWFFTLAHEIAHNLVQPHNSEHEFYFSAICEKHIVEFGKLISA